MLFFELKWIVALCGVVLMICAGGHSDQDTNICPNESHSDVSWPNTPNAQCARSDPFCIGENMEILSRCCDSKGHWENEPVCNYCQDIIKNPCPDHFDWRNNICIFIIENTTYPPRCPYEETLPFSEYFSLLDEQIFPIWMPVTRNVGDYGIDILRWTEPTSDYKSPYKLCKEPECNDSYVHNKLMSKRDCLIYHGAEIVEAVYCNEEHNAVCAYQKLPDRQKSFCSQTFSKSPCIQSDYSTYSKCFCRGLLRDLKAPRAELLEPYQNLLYSLNDTCYIGLKKVNGSYVWMNSNTSLKYTNWADGAVFDKGYKHTAITSSGWILTKNEKDTDCVLYEAEVATTGGYMALTYSKEDQQFILNLTNPSSWLFENGLFPMVFCFTDAARDALISKLDITSFKIVSADEALFYFKEHADGPGTYWCEAFLYPDLRVKSSNKYLLRFDDYTEEYVVILKKKYSEDDNIITEKNISQYQKLLAEQILSFPSISHYIPRIFKIVEMDEVNFEITINFHLVNPKPSKPLTDYSKLNDCLDDLTDFTYVEIFTVDTCVGIQTDSQSSVIWPSTPINTAAKPKQGFCVSSNGSIVNKFCWGNYIDGARWMDLSEPCTLQQSTNATVNLTNIINQHNPNDYVDQIVEISKHSTELTVRDIELIAQYFTKVSHIGNINTESIVTVTNHLMDVPKEVLKESQALYSATDQILYQLRNILNQSESVEKLTTENLIILSYIVGVSNLSAFVITENNGNYNVTEICNSYNLSEILQTDGFKLALLLNEDIISALKEDPLHSRIIVTIYKNSRLFNEVDKDNKETDLVIAITFPYIPHVETDISTVYRIDKAEDEDIVCSFWDYEVGYKKGYWAETLKERSNTSISCSYQEPMHFSLVRNEKTNITEQLEKILLSEVVMSEKLTNVSVLISNHYGNLLAIDLKLVSDLMEQAAEDNENVDMGVLTDIINTILDVNEDVLKISQRQYNATGRILFFFEQILQNSDSLIIKKSNFYSIVHILESDNLFYGFTIDHCDEKCNLTILHEETGPKEISLTKKLDTALILSRDLIIQFFYNTDYIPKIVVTVFFKSFLFIDHFSNPDVITKVVGVSFPNFDIPNLNGKLTLLYDLNFTQGLNYTTCSVYQNINNEPTIINGFWNQETDSEFKQGFQMCDFWKLQYFALIKNSMNITHTLELLLESADDTFIILNRTSYIIKKFNQFFEPIDVFYVAKILYKVKHVNETILEICLDIISDIMDLDSIVLQISHEEYNATDIILSALNDIAGKYTEAIEIYKDNVLFIISLLKETETYEVIIENCTGTCKLIIINLVPNTNSTFQISSSTLLDGHLVLSSDLIASIVNAKSDTYIPRLVVKMFYSDVLFVDQNKVTSATQVFGLDFPDYNQSLSGEINLKLWLPTDGNSHDYKCVKWMLQDEEADDTKSYWIYSSKPRDNTFLACSFFEAGYFALTENDMGVTDVTEILEQLSYTNMSFISKLYKTQDLSYYYSEFQPYDMYLVSQILAQCNKLTNNELDKLIVIIDNILRTPEDVLVEASVSYNALRQILHEINYIASIGDSDQYFKLYEMFGLGVCHLKSDTSNEIILTSSGIKCTHEVDDATFNYAENVVASVILSKEVVEQALTYDESAKMIVTIFFNTVFFNIEALQSNTLVLGLSIPSIDDELKGDVVALFNHPVCDYECGYWKNFEVWEITDGNYKDLFKECVYSEATYFSLLEYTGSDITKMLQDIFISNSTPLLRLQRTLNVISMYSKQFQASHVFLVSKILSTIDEVTLPCLQVTANITSSMMSLPRNILTQSQVQYGATDWILYYIDRIAEKIDEEVQITTENFSIVIWNNISTIIIENCNIQCEVKPFTNKVNLTGLITNVNLNAVLILDGITPQGPLDDPSAIAITVFCNNALFNEGGHTAESKNMGPIIGMVIPAQEDTSNRSFQFYYYTETKSAGVCAFWDYTVEEDRVTKGHWRRDMTLSELHMHACESKHTAHFALLQAEKNVTTDLEDILNSNSTTKDKLDKIVVIITDLAGNLEPVDIYLISKILELALKDIDPIKMNITSQIISGLFNVSRDVLRESQVKYSATDTILYVVDEMTKALTATDIHPIVIENFTMVIYDLKESDISGVLLGNCSEVQCDVSPLEGALNLTELVTNENLQTAVVLSEELRNQVRYSSGSGKLAVTIYFSDALFNEESERSEGISMVCGVLLPGFNESFLGNLYVLLNNGDDARHNDSCAFWDFQVLNGEETIKGSWSSEVDSPRTKEHFTICEYEHVTHFALLLATDDDSFSEADKYNLLDIITAVESVLSVIGLLGILLTAILFERWRRNTGNQILVHFSIAISVKMIMIYVSASVYIQASHKLACSITGAILHYSILSEFCWMLIIAILQFKRFVEVLGGPPKFVLLKACVCGWLFPVLPVMLILLIDKDNYNEGLVGLCYPSGLGLYLGIWLPLIIIVSINFVIFIFIIYNVFHKKTETRDMVNHEILFQWRLALLLFSMLGLTWLFGFLSQIPGAGEIFVYLFCITATLQGFIMFLFFIVFNKSTRFLYSQSIKMWLFSRGYKEQ